MISCFWRLYFHKAPFEANRFVWKRYWGSGPLIMHSYKWRKSRNQNLFWSQFFPYWCKGQKFWYYFSVFVKSVRVPASLGFLLLSPYYSGLSLAIWFSGVLWVKFVIFIPVESLRESLKDFINPLKNNHLTYLNDLTWFWNFNHLHSLKV